MSAERQPHPPKSDPSTSDARARYFVAQPAPPPPQVGASPHDLQKIRKLSKWGVILARVGATFPFVEPGVVNDKGELVSGTLDEYGEPKDVVHMRRVRNLKDFPRAKVRARCLHCALIADTREELEAAHYRVHGTPAAMEAKAIRHVWAWEAEEIPAKARKLHGVNEFGAAKAIEVVEPIGLLSDRLMAD